MAKFENNKACHYLFFIYFAFTLKISTISCESKFPMAFYDSVYVPRPKDSVFISPAGLKASLAASALGAGGDTRREIVNVINSTDDHLDIDMLLPGELKNLQHERRIYEIKNFFGVDYKSKLSRAYKFEDIIFGPSDTLKTINKFVKEVTHNTIQNIFLNSLSSDTTGATINSLYLNAEWKTEFTSVVIRSFKKPMVHQYNYFFFANLTDLNAAALQLEFKDSDAKLLVLQPNDNDLSRLGDKLLKTSLTGILSRLNKTRMSLYFPIIEEIKMSISVNDVLRNMGMESAFTKEANFGREVDCDNFNRRAYLRTVRQHTSFESDRLRARFVAVTAMQYDRAVDNRYSRDSSCSCNGDEYSLQFADPSDLTEKVALQTYKKGVRHYYFENKLFLALIRNEEILFLGTVAKEK